MATDDRMVAMRLIDRRNKHSTDCANAGSVGVISMPAVAGILILVWVGSFLPPGFIHPGADRLSSGRPGSGLLIVILLVS